MQFALIVVAIIATSVILLTFHPEIAVIRVWCGPPPKGVYGVDLLLSPCRQCAEEAVMLTRRVLIYACAAIFIAIASVMAWRASRKSAAVQAEIDAELARLRGEKSRL